MNYKKEMPLLNDVTFLDAAGSTPTPLSVIAAISNYYKNNSTNPHSSDTIKGIEINKLIKEARKKIADLIDAKPNEVIFTSGTTDSINKIARMFEYKLKKGDEILLSKYNHNSNLAPWLELAKRTGAVPVITEDVSNAINNKTRIVAISEENNAIGKAYNMPKLFEKVRSVDAYLFNDAAQAITKGNVTLKNSCVLAFSGFKFYGPSGIGVLVVREKLLNNMRPSIFGGGAIANIKGKEYILKNSIEAFEPGTPNIAGIIGLDAAVDFFHKTKDDLSKLNTLSKYAYDNLMKIKDIVIDSERGNSIIIFHIKGVPSQDVVSSLGHKNIMLRAGAFCNHLGMTNKDGSIRMSIGIYNNKEDIDKAIKYIKKGDFLDFI